MKHTIKMSAINLRGGLREKSAEIDLILADYKIDILGVSESNQLKDDYIEVANKNYSFEPCFNYTDKKTRLGVFIKNTIKYKIRRDKMTALKMPTVWLELDLLGKKMVVINVYREFKFYLPKSRDLEAHHSGRMSAQIGRFEEFVTAWEDALNEYDEVWVMGDFNFDL